MGAPHALFLVWQCGPNTSTMYTIFLVSFHPFHHVITFHLSWTSISKLRIDGAGCQLSFYMTHVILLGWSDMHVAFPCTLTKQARSFAKGTRLAVHSAVPFNVQAGL